MTNTENVLYPAPTHRYKVLVVCNTYNHSKYIEETLNGFAIQQTNFPFTCLVMDDASTDGEQEVLKGWMRRECDMSKSEVIDISTSEVIIVPHRTNTSCNFAFYLLKQNLYGNPKKNDHVMPWRDACDYEAICEGDDYWIDPLKLQKQVDFLDNNPEYGMCYTKAKAINEAGRITIIGSNVSNLNALFMRNTICTLTVCLRTELMSKYYRDIKPENHNWLMGDYPLWIWIYLNSGIHFCDDITSVYRVLKTSASHSILIEKQIAFIESSYDIRHYYIKEYLNEDKKLTKIADTVRRWSIFRSLIIAGENSKAFEYLDAYSTELTLKYKLYSMLIKNFRLVRYCVTMYFNYIA